MMCVSDDDWDEFLFEVREQMMTVDASVLGIDGEYFKLCKILRELPDKCREYY